MYSPCEHCKMADDRMGYFKCNNPCGKAKAYKKNDDILFNLINGMRSKEMQDSIKNFNNWVEVKKGLYRYVISAGACYEIYILFHDHNTDILTAKASLYIAGDWYNHNTKLNYFERECLLSERIVLLFKCGRQ